MRGGLGMYICCGMILFVCRAGAAAPFIPAHDHHILEQLPRSADIKEQRALRQLRDAALQQPQDLARATELAQRYIMQARRQGDPRFLGYAQGVLTPWWNIREPPTTVLLLRATIAQSLHDFTNALRDLDHVLRRVPGHAQARLTRATIYQVQGEYTRAKNDCLDLYGYSQELIWATCLAETLALTGQADQAQSLLQQVLKTNYQSNLSAWAWTIAAEIAVRRGDQEAAERLFKRALAITPEDNYLEGAYADFLLDSNKPQTVIARLTQRTRSDSLLLRLVLAEQRVNAPTYAQHRAELAQRYAATRSRGDVTHQREEARFMLHVERNPQAALLLAQRNWAVQREPWDTRILLEAAHATGNAAAARPVIEWIKKNRFEDHRITPLTSFPALLRQ